MTTPHGSYTTQTFNLSGLEGISDKTLEMHFKLYDGYVKQTNLLNEQIGKILEDGKIDQEETPAYSELTRRLGFEYNGMVLHEYYFGNLKANVAGLEEGSSLGTALVEQFGSFEAWKEDFLKAGASRSIGWAVLFLDPSAGTLNNHFVQLHEEGNVAGFVPVLVMDVWEHAYMVDYGALGRPDYMKSFAENVNWDLVARRYEEATKGKIPARW